MTKALNSKTPSWRDFGFKKMGVPMTVSNVVEIFLSEHHALSFLHFSAP
jgi:hypothetical protein